MWNTANNIKGECYVTSNYHHIDVQSLNSNRKKFVWVNLFKFMKNIWTVERQKKNKPYKFKN